MSIINNSKSPKLEAHPQLPSGEWEGFYCYNYSPRQHKMSIELLFANSIVSGFGVDDVSAFTWEGMYDIEDFKIQMTKSYLSHEVEYKGDIDENGIWGTWQIGNPSSGLLTVMTGGFHIWPKKSESEKNSNSFESKIESKKLKKIFVEVFE